jgi:hypothetical protein
MCVVAGCAVAPDPIYLNTGLRAGFCTHHHGIYTARLDSRAGATSAQPRVANPYVNRQVHADHLKLLALMHEADTVLAAISSLNTAVEAFRQNKDDPHIAADLFRGQIEGDSNYIRVSRALEYFERYCWFPQQHIVFLKSLTGNDFYGYLNSGIMPAKDPGAGAAHGDFSHRLQWHAVMWVITQGFTVAIRPGWHHSPFELFTTFGRDEARQNNAWGVIFDAAGTNCFRDPAFLRDRVERNTSGTMAFLAANLVRRFQKRQSLELVIRDHLRQHRIDTGVLGPTGAADSAGAFIYQWMKTGMPHKTILESYKRNLTGLVPMMANAPLDALAVQAFGAGIAASLCLSKQGKDFRKVGQIPHYQVIASIHDGENGPVGVPRTDADRGYSAAQRTHAVISSRNGFNPEFGMTPVGLFRSH